jgi:hypothetical protein
VRISDFGLKDDPRENTGAPTVGLAGKPVPSLPSSTSTKRPFYFKQTRKTKEHIKTFMKLPVLAVAFLFSSVAALKAQDQKDKSSMLTVP